MLFYQILFHVCQVIWTKSRVLLPATILTDCSNLNNEPVPECQGGGGISGSADPQKTLSEVDWNHRLHLSPPRHLVVRDTETSDSCPTAVPVAVRINCGVSVLQGHKNLHSMTDLYLTMASFFFVFF